MDLTTVETNGFLAAFRCSFGAQMIIRGAFGRFMFLRWRFWALGYLRTMPRVLEDPSFLEDGASGAWRCRSSQNSMYKLQNPFVLTVVELIITPLKLLELEVKNACKSKLHSTGRFEGASMFL